MTVSHLCKIGLSGSALKVIALLSMTIDHIACYLMTDSVAYELMRSVGRIAFPIFAFLLVEGFVHTHSRKQYAFNLFAFALVSDIPWWLLNHDNSHNVFFTLLLGLLALMAVQRCKATPWLQCFAVGMLALVATWMHTDYEWHGVLLIVFFYLFRRQWPLITIFSIPVMVENGLLCYLVTITLLAAYNEERGCIRGIYAKYSIYAYYPIHMCLFYLLIDHPL